MTDKLLFLLLSIFFINSTNSQDNADEGVNVIQDVSASIPNGILNPADIDWDFIVNSLITPKGLVTQFALEVEVQSIFTLGWIIAGVIWQVVVLNTTGELQTTLSGLSFLLSTNALAQTVVRSLFDSARSLASRLIITIFVYGWEDTINGVIANADPFDIGDFLFNPVVLLVAAGRAVAQVVYFFSALGPLVYFALNIWPNIRPPKEETKRLLKTGDYYGEYYGRPELYYDSDDYGYTDWSAISQVRATQQDEGIGFGQMLQDAMNTIVDTI